MDLGLSGKRAAVAAASAGLGLWLRHHVRRFDVVHIHGLYQFHTTVAARYCRRADVPYVIRPHGALDPYHLRQHRWRKALVTSLAEGRAVRAAAAMHYTSTASTNYASRGPTLRRGRW